jgi:hypothetical protein
MLRSKHQTLRHPGSSDVSIIGNSISIIDIESKVTAIRFGFLNFVPHQFFSYRLVSRLVITSILCTTALFTLAIVLKYYVNCS